MVSHLISKIEADSSDVQFSRVDSDTIDKLIEKDDAIASKLSEKEEEDLKKIIEDSVEGEKFSVDIQSMDSKELPIIITQSEFMRRMKEQQALSGGMQMFGSMPEKYNLVINSNHQLIAKVLAEKTNDKRELLIQQLIDLALLSQDMLKERTNTVCFQNTWDGKINDPQFKKVDHFNFEKNGVFLNVIFMKRLFIINIIL